MKFKDIIRKRVKTAKNGKRKYHSIATQLSVSIVGIAAVAVIVLCTTLVLFFNSYINSTTDDQLASGAEANALRLEKYIGELQLYSEAMGESFRNFKVMGEAQGGAMIRSTLKTAVESGRVYSAYAAFEPNIFFSSTPRGLSYYAYNLDGEAVVDTANDYDVYSTADYYSVTKNSLNIHVTQPYEWTMSDGSRVWLITLSSPILLDGQFAGVANCDILADSLLGLKYAGNGFESQYQTFIDDSGKTVMHTGNPAIAGTESGAISYIRSQSNGTDPVIGSWNDDTIGGKATGAFVPVRVEGTDLDWFSGFVVSYSEAHNAILRTVGFLIIFSLIGLVVMAVLSVSLLKRTMAPLKPLSEMADSLGSFELDKIDTSYSFPNNEIGALAERFIDMSNRLRFLIGDVSMVLDEMAAGNFSIRTKHFDDYTGEMKKVIMSIRKIRNDLGKALKDIRGSADQIAGNSNQIADGAQGLAQGASEQASSLEELTSMVGSINDDVRRNARSSSEASTIANNTKSAIEASNREMLQLREAMDDIASSSMQIQTVIGLIDNIAFQTNILALNAAIEAARAGEAGKGFAVVADEVRNLAQKSAEAAQSTGTLISTSVEAVEKGKGIATETAEALIKVAEYAEKTGEMIGSISAASDKQAEAIEQINVGLTQISSVVQTNSSTSEESAAASQELSNEADRLRSLVSKYRFEE